MAFPKTQSGSDLDARGAVRARRGAVPGAGPALRRRARAAASRRPWRSHVRRLVRERRGRVRRVWSRGRIDRRRPARRPRAPQASGFVPVDADRAAHGGGRRSSTATLVGVVPPDAEGAGRGAAIGGRGVGRRAGRARAARSSARRERRADPRRAARRASAAQAFLEATGFAFHSPLWDLELPTRRPVADPAWPEGSRPGRSGRAATSSLASPLFNAAFAGPPDAAAARRHARRSGSTTPTLPRRRHDPRRGRGPAGSRRSPPPSRSAAPTAASEPAGRDLDDRRPAGAPGPRGWGASCCAGASRSCGSIGVDDRDAVSVNGRNPRASRPVRGRGLRADVDPRPLGAARGRPADLRREPARRGGRAGRGRRRSSGPSRSRSRGSSTSRRTCRPRPACSSAASTACRCSSSWSLGASGARSGR